MARDVVLRPGAYADVREIARFISERGSPAPGAKLAMRTFPSLVPALREANFTVMSLAGNHALDFGAHFIQVLAHQDAFIKAAIQRHAFADAFFGFCQRSIAVQAERL